MLEEVRQEERSKLSRLNPSSSTITRSDPKLDAMPGVRVAEDTNTVTGNSLLFFRGITPNYGILLDFAHRTAYRFRNIREPVHRVGCNLLWF
jgi:hypothetical protein